MLSERAASWMRLSTALEKSGVKVYGRAIRAWIELEAESSAGSRSSVLAAGRQRDHVHTPTPPYFCTARHVQVWREGSFLLPILPPTIYL